MLFMSMSRAVFAAPGGGLFSAAMCGTKNRVSGEDRTGAAQRLQTCYRTSDYKTTVVGDALITYLESHVMPRQLLPTARGNQGH
jgi:hypothetical protein